MYTYLKFSICLIVIGDYKQYVIIAIPPPPNSMMRRYCVQLCVVQPVNAMQAAKPPEWKNVHFGLLIWECEFCGLKSAPQIIVDFGTQRVGKALYSEARILFMQV